MSVMFSRFRNVSDVKEMVKSRGSRRIDSGLSSNCATGEKSGGKLAKTAREGSKTATVLELLKQPEGVSLTELMKATGWQAHSVRGFLSAAVGKKMGLAVTSSKSDEGKRRYTIAR
jgi:hypothetical protein